MSVGKSWSNQIEFWLLWMFVLGISWPAVSILSALLITALRFPLESKTGMILTIALGGMLVGVIQWFILQPGAIGIIPWILATAAGWALAFGVTTSLSNPEILNLSWLLGGVLGGLVFGVAQWFVMRFQLKISWEWLIQSAISWTAAPILGFLISKSIPQSVFGEQMHPVIFSALLGWAILGVLSCLILLTIFPQQAKRDRDKYIRWLP